MYEITTEVTEEIVIRELTINELESVNGGMTIFFPTFPWPEPDC